MQDLIAALGLKRGHFFFAALAFLAWILIVVSSGAGWNPANIAWSFANPGAFGDSFGPVNTFMALLAALGAIAAYKSQAKELKRTQIRQEELDEIASSDRVRVINRENEIDKRAAKVSFETSFFNLLSSFRSLVGMIDVKKRGEQVVAHDAFDEMVRKVENIVSSYSVDTEYAWQDLHKYHLNDLNH